MIRIILLYTINITCESMYFILNSECKQVIIDMIESQDIIPSIKNNIYIQEKSNTLLLIIFCIFFIKYQYFIYLLINLIMYKFICNICDNKLCIIVSYCITSIIMIRIFGMYYSISNYFHDKNFIFIIFMAITMIIFEQIYNYIYINYQKIKIYKEIKNTFGLYLSSDNKLEIPINSNNKKYLQYLNI